LNIFLGPKLTSGTDQHHLAPEMAMCFREGECVPDAKEQDREHQRCAGGKA